MDIKAKQDLLNINIKKKFYKIKEKINKKSVEEILNEEIMAGKYGLAIKDFMVCGERLVTLNDYIIINKRGIFLLNINKGVGIISGTVENDSWISLNKNKLKNIKNPIKDLLESLDEVKRFVNDKYVENIYTKVIFTRAKDIEDLQNGIVVRELDGYINKDNNILSYEEVKNIFEELEIINIKDKSIRKKRKKLKRNYEMNIIHSKEAIEAVDRVKILNEMRV